MQFRNVTVEQAQLAASQVPAKLQNVQVHAHHFTAVIRPTQDTDDSLRPRGSHNRRIAALDWTGHRMFFDALFTIAPEAEVKSTQAHYTGIKSYLVQVPSSSIRLSEVPN